MARTTLWTVDYTGIGYNGTYRRWFDNAEDAKEFSKRDYADAPVKRTYTAENAKKKIAEAKECEEWGL